MNSIYANNFSVVESKFNLCGLPLGSFVSESLIEQMMLG